MAKFFKHDIICFKQYNLSDNYDYFNSILEERKREPDSKRFFLEYIPNNILEKYNFSDKNSVESFRNLILEYDSPLKLMGGCNLESKFIEKGIRYSGIQISDPNGMIYGLFYIMNKTIIYSPIFPHFYEQRDLIKFAKDSYFTSISFQEIMIQQIDLASEFYVHIDNYRSSKDVAKYGEYVMKKINKDKMLEFISDSSKGEKIYKKYFKI